MAASKSFSCRRASAAAACVLADEKSATASRQNTGDSGTGAVARRSSKTATTSRADCSISRPDRCVMPPTEVVAY